MPWKKFWRVFHAMEDFCPPVENLSTGGQLSSTGGKTIHRWMGGMLLELAGFDDFLGVVGEAAGGGRGNACQGVGVCLELLPTQEETP